MDFKSKKLTKYLLSSLAMLAMLLMLFGCSGSDGAAGAAGAAGTSTGVVSGTITSDGTNPLSGVVVSNNLTTATATTDGVGNYSLTLPIGVYTLSFTKTNYTTGTATVSVIAGTTSPVKTNVTLSATSAGKPSVTVTAAANNIGFDSTTTVTATATAPSGGTISYSWSGTDAASTTNTATVRTLTLAKALGGTAAPSSDPGGYVAAYVQEDLFGILPIIPDTKGGKTATVTANDGKGQSTSASVTVYAAGISTGLRNVPMGVPVYLNSGHDTGNAWTVTSAPSGSAVATGTLKNAATRNASFTPDKAGKYTVKEGANSMDIYAGTWVGAISGGTEDANGLPSVTPDASLCTLCHNGVNTMNGITIPDKFTPWAKTPHATFYATGLNGLTSNNRSTCPVCHTVGYDDSPAAVNGGYDDLVTLTGWSYPSKAQKGNWAAMWADSKGKVVARMTNIQCENCHGPNSDNTAHTSTRNGTTYTQGLRTSLSADICATCHASGTGHHNYSEWKQIDPDTGYGHSKAHKRGTTGSFATSSSCARCHTGQGFLTYLTQLKAGDIGSINGTLTDVVTTSNAVGVTCSACHDPHDAEIGGQLSTATGVPKSTQLRVFGDTELLPAGFKAKGMGAGALCFTCHNSRNGAQSGSDLLTYLHEDGETYNGGNPTGYSAPHQAAQGDVFAGRNAYFMGSLLPMVSKHASVEESCVGCHIKLNPQTHLSHGSAATSGHVMFIRSKDRGTLCANCHGTTNGEGLVASIEAGLEALNEKMGTAAKTKINATGTIKVRAYSEATDLYSSTSSSNSNVTIDVTANPVTHVTVVEGHGQIEFHITLTSAINITWTDGSTTSTKEFGVQLGSLKDNGGTVLYGLGGKMVRAGWNYFLIEGDQSKGIHNPTFATLVINNTLAQDLSN